MTVRFFLPALCLLAGPLTSFAQKPRIIGGEDATAGQFPWMAGLLVKDEPDTFLAQDCGGALVHPYWVVTAAHCVEFRDPADMQVVVGATNLSEAGLVRYNVAEVIMHPDYRPWSNDHDIALVLLTDPVTGIEPLEIISDPALTAAGVPGLALGWGDTVATGDPVYPEVLQAVELPIIDTEVANQPDWHNGGVTPSMFAAGYADGGKDTCGGDSGGPFIVRGSSGQWLLAGVINWGGDVCAEAKKPGVYCRVSRYRQWMQSIIWPKFHQWETGAGISTDDGPDVDGDGASQWLEYALRRDPREADNGLMYPGFTLFEGLSHATLSVKRPVGGGDISWGLQGSVGLSEWTPLNPELQLTGPAQGIANDPASELVTWRGLPEHEGRSFMRAIIKPGVNWQPHARALEYPGFVQHALHTLEQPVGGFYVRDYELTGLVTGRPTRLTLHSENFDSVLHLVNAATGAILQTSNTNTADGSDESVLFTPDGTRYLARVTTSTEGELGGYELIFDRSPSTIVAGNERNGSLDNFDPLDDLEPNYVLYKDDFLWFPTDTTLTTFTLSSSEMDPVVSIVDAATGELMNYSLGAAGIGTALLTWEPIPFQYYFIRVTSLLERGTGDYTLRVSNTPTITVGGTANGTFDANDGLDPYYTGLAQPEFYYTDDYAFNGAAGGQLLTVTMSAALFGTSIEILDALTGESITSDFSTAAGVPIIVEFNTETGVNYIIRVSTAGEVETGAYTLSVTGG